MSLQEFSSEYAPEANLNAKEQLLTCAIGPEEQSAITQISDLIHPPPTLLDLKTAAKTLERLEYISSDTVKPIDIFVSRNGAIGTLQHRYHERCFPTFHFVRKLCSDLGDDLEASKLAIELVWRLQKSLPAKHSFSKHNYYEHHLALRVLYTRYCHSEKFSESATLRFFQRFLEELLDGSLLDVKRRARQINICLALLDGEVLLGEKRKLGVRGASSHKPRKFKINPQASSEMSPLVYLQAAEIHDEFMEEEETDLSSPLTTQVRLPDGATFKDKRSIFNFATNGFERRNVPCRADMRACSEIAYAGYLTYAIENASPQAYALTWLAAFIGFDTNRDIRQGTADPVNEEAMLDTQKKCLSFNVIRRSNANDIGEYETAGMMSLELPTIVSEGLKLMDEAESQSRLLQECDDLSRKYARSHSGIRPTLPRLRNSAFLSVGLSQMAQLELSALAGRVPPSLKGISAYYPLSSEHLNAKFRSAYESTIERLSINAPPFQNKLVHTNSKIFVQRSYTLDAVSELVAAIGEAYAAKVEYLHSQSVLVQTEDVVSTLQLHELARYALQQTFLGIRPVGKVAALQISNLGHALVCDKSSRLFSERSYTPVSNSHLQFLGVSDRNADVLSQFTKIRGLRFKKDEPNSDLAQRLVFKSGSNDILASRLTNEFFRQDAPITSSKVDPLFEHNWLRKVTANTLWKKEAQWMIDELFGHRRCGREAFSTWSTTDVRSFQELSVLIDRLIKEVLDPRLLLPVRLFEVNVGT